MLYLLMACQNDLWSIIKWLTISKVPTNKAFIKGAWSESCYEIKLVFHNTNVSNYLSVHPRFCSTFMQWLRLDKRIQTGFWVAGPLIDSQLLCRQLRDRRLSPLTGRSQTLYIRDCCWQERFVQPDLDGRIPYRRDISFPPLCPAASPPTGWLWTGRRVSARHRESTGRSAIFTDHEGNVGHSAAAALAQDLCAAQIRLQTTRCLGYFPANAKKSSEKDAALSLQSFQGDTHPEESI